MEMDPHQLIEGMVIAGKAVGSHQGYIYIRGEYRYVQNIFDARHRRSLRARLPGQEYSRLGFDFDVCSHTGAGSYECGEESALMESLEGKRGYPRIRPPFPAVVGLYGCPTVINNAETLSSVPSVIRLWRRRLCEYGHSEKWRHAPLLDFRPRQSPGHLRIADGLQPEALHRRSCRRRAGRQEN